MKWSWKLGRFAGIDAYVHASFLLIVAWAAWAAYQGAGSGLAAVLGVVFLLGIFGSVLLHELGHALTARRYGIRTRRIVLLPIGGIAQLEGEPRTPRQELLIALAGPAVNFALAAGLFVLDSAFASWGGFGLLGSLMVANVALGLFNLVPAFPMDGGRAFRALLSTRVGSLRATEIAVKVARVAAAAFVVLGLFTSWTLALIGVFIWFAAGAESRRRAPAYSSPSPYDVVPPPVAHRSRIPPIIASPARIVIVVGRPH
jgi:Zn-dependent protease